MVKHFSSLIREFVKLAQSSPEEQQRQVESAHAGDAKVAGSLEAVLCQMVAHNSYHAGQIALIRRAVGAGLRGAAGRPGRPMPHVLAALGYAEADGSSCFP